MAPLRLTALAVAAALVAACEPLADRDYPGEPLLSVRGTVLGATPLPPLEAALLVQLGPPPSTDQQVLATRAPVQRPETTGASGPTGPGGPAYTATFTLTVYQPPGDAALRTLRAGEVAWARASAGAVPYGLSADAAPALPTSGSTSYGLDLEHWVVWLAADVPAGSLTAWWLGAALPAGYHVLRVKPYDPCADPAGVEACVSALGVLGVPDDGTESPGTARAFCTARYRLEPAAAGEGLRLLLGATAPPPGGACP